MNAASRFCGTNDIEIYKIELWAEYSGTVDYDQEHHRDHNNHSLVVPRADGRWPQLTTFLLLSDVTDEDGPTKVVPRAVNDTMPRWPHMVEDGDCRENEIAITGPAGSLFFTPPITSIAVQQSPDSNGVDFPFSPTIKLGGTRGWGR